MQTIQQFAASAIGEVLAGRNLNQVLNEIFRQQLKLTSQQRGAVQDISYGTLRFYGQLAAVLECLLNKPLQDKAVRNLLLVALYQLQYSKAAPYAVVDHAVVAAKKINGAVGGLVNAVLRNFMRNKQALLDKANQTATGRYSYPQWWIDKLHTQHGDQAESVLRAGNLHPPMTLRVNSRKSSAEEYIERLQEQGIDASLISPGAILLGRPLAVDSLPGFREGLVSVQDAGAQYAAKLLNVQNGMKVLDACAAPGGKTAHLLESADIELLALDSDAQRLHRVEENLQRLQLRAELRQGDAAHPEAWWDGRSFDCILADVPCSASGVVRRHPDIKWLRRPSDIAGFTIQQSEILHALWPLLANGGKLLYATCSVFAEENWQLIDNFLAHTTDAIAMPITGPDIENGQILPNEQHDGFFYALLQKAD